MFRWVNCRDPRRYGLAVGVWTRSIVALLIRRKCGVRLGTSAVGALFAKLELALQKPLRRAYQRDPQAIARRQREDYPALVRPVRRQGAGILFWDESGFLADTVRGKTWGSRGQTLIEHRPGQRQSVSAASAASA